METVLNLIWLVITLAGVWLWRFRWFTSRGGRRDRIFTEAVAIVCLIALLFPVISLTDDLHPEIMIADCASAKRSICLLVPGPHTASASHARQIHFAAALIARPLADGEILATRLAFSDRALSAFVSWRIPSGRSPPSLLQL